ncbi:Uncharacterized conserved protein, DUF305 family [Modestobacter sp. DSM 44400]|uniref:DUF305 domain-containing protein n=1 Tax=Modestobacter sp. DSM 44400 TaxID=1550230 RepID=UPI00089CB6A4|nr:DUF305 domain-containing protein [Modestobacter sp. DSM 44400]SDX65001.1 Uncharacterized conserved protein, DUF305 family [Modestobacter sp. DSM 44400]
MTHPTAARDDAAPPPRRRLTTALLAVIAVGLLVAGGGLAVGLGIGRTETPAADSVDAGFARDMSRHHLQAVEMANLTLQRTQDAEVRRLAFDISATQTNQVGRMQGWLSLWGLPPSGSKVMAWMSADADSMPDAAAAADGAVMPGMATEAELAELRSLSGTELDVRFLKLMMRHHQGGLEMAQYGHAHATQPAVRTLARSIAETQAAETATMEDMLRARGAAPLPAP